MKRKLKTWPVIILVVFLILIICIISIISSLKGSRKISTKRIGTIEKYNYNLNENANEYYKKLFRELKNELKQDTVDEEKYATIISKMFLSDFLNLDSAINKNDIGGLDFIYKDYKEIFKIKAKDTIYGYVENNIYGNRKQELPIVEKVKILNIKKGSYNGEIKQDSNAFYVNCEIIYKKDLGYQKEINLIIVHNNNKLEIVSME